MSKKKKPKWKTPLDQIRTEGRVRDLGQALGSHGALGPQAFEESKVARDLAATFAQLEGERVERITVDVPPEQLDAFLLLWRDDEGSGRSTLVLPSIPVEPTRPARHQYPRLVHVPDEDEEWFSLTSLIRSETMAYLTELGEGAAASRGRRA